MLEFADAVNAAMDSMRNTAVQLTSHGGRPDPTSASRLYALFTGCAAFAAVGLPSLLLRLFRNRRGRHGPPTRRRGAGVGRT